MKDPRLVGGRYRNGYWGHEYTVLSIKGVVITIVIQTPYKDGTDSTGKVVEHYTGWDQKLDSIVRAPKDNFEMRCQWCMWVKHCSTGMCPKCFRFPPVLGLLP